MTDFLKCLQFDFSKEDSNGSEVHRFSNFGVYYLYFFCVFKIKFNKFHGAVIHLIIVSKRSPDLELSPTLQNVQISVIKIMEKYSHN